MKSRKFVDSVIIHVKAGYGGNGRVSFRREKYIPKGGPDGGDGGRGGHVILTCDRDTDSLIHLSFAPHQYAKNGEHGGSQRSHGRDGENLILKVPCGTEVWNIETDEIAADLVEHGDSVIIAHGGKGGLGNCHWKTSTHQTPIEHTDGEQTRALSFRLELKLVADIGLVGFPNAGKSSLLARISDAHPKIGAYPFTTLNPLIGTIVFDNYTQLRVADVPGIIKNAHKGSGLGHAFLRHIERSRCIIFVLDMAGVDMRCPWDDYVSLEKELNLYHDGITTKPSFIVANKMDLPESKDNMHEFVKQVGIEPIPVSAITGEGIELLLKRIRVFYTDR
ncbi:MAG: GTPase ObgE [Lentisphaerae bacterium]|nr:GTPase ObgE [Lentisphaerota bacterium]